MLKWNNFFSKEFSIFAEQNKKLIEKAKGYIEISGNNH